MLSHIGHLSPTFNLLWLANILWIFLNPGTLMNTYKAIILALLLTPKEKLGF